MSKLSQESLIRRLSEMGYASRADLVAALRVDPSTIFRHLGRAEKNGAVVRFGRGPTTRYAVRDDLFGLPRIGETPIYRVQPSGLLIKLGVLVGIANHLTLFASAQGDLPTWMRGQQGNGVFNDLPFFLQDLRPQGFMGRYLAHALPGYPDNPTYWQTQDVARYLLDIGVDFPGDLLLGESAAQRFEAWTPEVVEPDDFPGMADRALAGGIPGSSAGGEQPKWCALSGGRAVLVKFSPPAESSPVAERWRDLLICEYLALCTLQNNKYPTVPHQLIERSGRWFLETVRFDRVGPRGRLPAISLQSLDAEYTGVGAGWSQTLTRLQGTGMLQPRTAEQGRILDLFGAWIENSDRHLGNLTLVPSADDRSLSLAPVYDMLPMRLAPHQGEVPPVPPWTPPIQDASSTAWRTSAHLANAFWRLVAQDNRVSLNFRGIAAERAKKIDDVLTLAESTRG